MSSILESIYNGLVQTTWIEAIAVISGIVSVWYSRKENILVFPTGLLNTTIYIYLSFKGHLLGEASVNLYYTIMSLYGWYLWTRKNQTNQEFILQITNSNTKERIQQFFAKHGMKTVFLGRFIPAVRFGVFFFAGRHRMNLRKFVGLNAIGALIYAPFWICLSALAGERFARTPAASRLAEKWVEQGSMILVGLVLVVVLAMFWGAGKKKG